MKLESILFRKRSQIDPISPAELGGRIQPPKRQECRDAQPTSNRVPNATLEPLRMIKLTNKNDPCQRCRPGSPDAVPLSTVLGNAQADRVR